MPQTFGHLLACLYLQAYYLAHLVHAHYHYCLPGNLQVSRKWVVGFIFYTTWEAGTMHDLMLLPRVLVFTCIFLQDKVWLGYHGCTKMLMQKVKFSIHFLQCVFSFACSRCTLRVGEVDSYKIDLKPQSVG